MAKVSEDAVVAGLPLDDERIEKPVKMNRHVVIALKHMKIQREALSAKIADLTTQRDDLDASIKALSPE